MAKSTKEVKEKATEVTLWEAANKLRGSVEPAEYKHPPIRRLFQAYMSQKTQKQINKNLPDCQIKSELLQLKGAGAFYTLTNSITP
jgi:type I restriction enzyme M protein